jgi:hypothetical protein
MRFWSVEQDNFFHEGHEVHQDKLKKPTVSSCNFVDYLPRFGTDLFRLGIEKLITNQESRGKLWDN